MANFSVVSSCTGTQRNETLTNRVTTPCMDMHHVWIYTRTAPTFLTNHNRSSGRRYGRRVLEGIGQSISVQKREGEL